MGGIILEEGKLKVLIADDNKDFCDLVCNFLDKQEDMEVIGVAYDGIEAYEMIVNEKPDVAILDGIMPRDRKSVV